MRIENRQAGAFLDKWINAIENSPRVREELGQSLYERFESADPTPLGEAGWSKVNPNDRYMFETVAIGLLEDLSIKLSNDSHERHLNIG